MNKLLGKPYAITGSARKGVKEFVIIAAPKTKTVVLFVKSEGGHEN